ncbi:MAG: hypothetical protein HC852_23490 [Acaryochloridaceae cyanobacterium RU_4_10]|nr:hypothetical protein [Acaryochloridaceae cyanobacterium RU_4_10]
MENILSSIAGLGGGGRAASQQPQATEILVLGDGKPLDVEFRTVRPLSIPRAAVDGTEPIALADPSDTNTTEPMHFARDLSDAELMAIVNQPQEVSNAQ